MKSNNEKNDTQEFTWLHLSILAMTMPILYFLASFLVLFLGFLFSLRPTYAYYLLYCLTAIFTGVLGAVYIPTLDTINATRIAKGMIGGWIAVFVYTLFATRFRTVSGISTQACENLSLFGVLVMPTIVAGLSGWFFYETVTEK